MASKIQERLNVVYVPLRDLRPAEYNPRKWDASAEAQLSESIKGGVSRATYYRWLEDDPIFRDAAMAALNDGEAFISDKSEAQLLALIGDKHFGAIKHYLEHHSDKYSKGSGLGGRPDRKIRVIILHDHED